MRLGYTLGHMSTLILNIDPALSERDGCLVLQLQENNLSKRVGQPTLLSLLGAKNATLAKLLITEEQSYREKHKKQENGFECFHVSFSKAFIALKELAASGLLRFKHKTVYCDFFGKTKLLARQQQSLTAVFLIHNEQEMPVNECEFIGGGPPHWYIAKNFIRFIDADISLKLLKTAAKGNWIATPKELEQLEEYFTTASQPAALKEASPLPLLKLTDRLGAFADLWLQYGNEAIPMHDPRKEIKGIKRNFSEEQGWEKDLLETGFLKKMLADSHYYCPLNLVAKTLSFLLDLGWHIQDRTGNTLVRLGQIALSASLKQADFIVSGKAVFDKTEVDLSDVAGAFVKRERFLQIGSGLTGLLPDSLPSNSLETLCEEGEILTEGVKLRRSQIGSLQELFQEHQVSASLDLEQLRTKLETRESVASYPPGFEFSGSLRPYQQKGVDWLHGLYELNLHGLLADDMGLGKTVQVLAFLSTLPRTAEPHLIIVPASLVFNWRRETERFLPGFHCIEHMGPQRTKSLAELQDADIILTSYATLKLDLPLLKQLDCHTVILDEAQMIKNAGTQAFLSVCQLAARFRLAMTGTPVENHLTELWSQFHFLAPNLLGSREEFITQVQSAEADKRYLQRIKAKVHPLILRRTKKEVAPELPEKIEQTIWIDFEESQQQIYEDFLAGVKGNLLKKVEVDGTAKHRMEILEAILRLRQICCHPALIQNLLHTETRPISSKLNAFLEDLEVAVAEGSKILVYSQFTSMLTLLANAFRERAWQFVQLDGSTQNREIVVQTFQENPAVSIFLISLKAGAFGLNLTAADYVFLYEPWWNEAVENQAIDRAHRIGRKDPVIAKRYAIRGSIEERVMQLKEKKSGIAAELFEDAAATGALSIENLRFMLS